MGKELLQPDPEHLALLVQVRPAQRQLRCPPRPRASGDLALLWPLPAPGRHQVQVIRPQPVAASRSRQPRQTCSGPSPRLTHPATRHCCQPSSRWPGGTSSICRTGSQPAPARNLIEQARQPPRLRPQAARCRAGEHVRQVPGRALRPGHPARPGPAAASAVTAAFRPARAGWAPGRPLRAAGPGPDARRPARTTSTRDLAGPGSHRSCRPHQPHSTRTRAAADAARRPAPARPAARGGDQHLDRVRPHRRADRVPGQVHQHEVAAGRLRDSMRSNS